MEPGNSTPEENIISPLIRKSLSLLKLGYNVEVFKMFNHPLWGELKFKLKIEEINSENFNVGDLGLTFSIAKEPISNCEKLLFVGNREELLAVLEAYSSNAKSIIDNIPNFYRLLFED